MPTDDGAVSPRRGAHSSDPSPQESARGRRLPVRCRRCGRFVEGTIPEFCAGCGAVHCPFCQAIENCEHRFAEVTDEGVYPPLVTDESAPRLCAGLSATASEVELREAFGGLFDLVWQAYAPSYHQAPPPGLLAELILTNRCDHTASVLCDFEPVGWGPGWIRYFFAEDPEAVTRRFAEVLDQMRAAFRWTEDLLNREPEEDDDADAPAQTWVPTQAATFRRPPGGARTCLRRSRRGTLPPSIILLPCGGARHRVGLPRRGPIVLLDHPDRASVEAALAGPEPVEGCLEVLRRVRARSSTTPWGWYMWLVHVAPRFGDAGETIRDRLREFDQRRKLRRLLRGVNIG